MNLIPLYPAQFDLVFLQGHLALATYFHYFLPKTYTFVTMTRIQPMHQILEKPKSYDTRRTYYPSMCKDMSQGKRCSPAICNCKRIKKIWAEWRLVRDRQDAESKEEKEREKKEMEKEENERQRVEGLKENVQNAEFRKVFKKPKGFNDYYSGTGKTAVDILDMFPSKRKDFSGVVNKLSSFWKYVSQSHTLSKLPKESNFLPRIAYHSISRRKTTTPIPEHCKDPMTQRCSQALCNCRHLRYIRHEIKLAKEELKKLGEKFNAAMVRSRRVREQE